MEGSNKSHHGWGGEMCPCAPEEECLFPDDIFKCIFLNENEWISLKISLKFILKVRINNIPALVQIMTWRRCSNYIWVINNLIAHKGATNIRDLTVMIFQTHIKDRYLKFFCEIALRSMPRNRTGDKPTLFQIMVWCRQTTSHDLNQCWTSSIMPYDFTRPQ